jgi:hypothetical protein
VISVRSRVRFKILPQLKETTYAKDKMITAPYLTEPSKGVDAGEKSGLE